ncbi:spore germination protein GerPC [Mesobacillus harenae]|uniref:spore germination protein GerPC n=1 Tax=Mesobacillus harenae TaxID=2213203 RepID=UPI0015807382|nr:spore germination protein GerPC [Mesobacillus harenae]
MSNNFYEYLKQLHTFIESQDRRIKELERLAKNFQAEITQLKDRNTVRVDRIEYKFDQLKVETLEGTLNIGLNPSDLQGIEDFSVDNQQIKTPFSPQDQFERTVEVERELDQYMQEKLPSIFKMAQEKLEIKVDDSYLDFIRQDITKQLPERINLYLKEDAASRSGSSKDESQKSVIDRLKLEIENGVLLFLKQLPDQVKGRKTE